MDNSSLAQLFRNLSDQLVGISKQISEIVTYIKKFPKTLQESVNTIVESINNLMMSQFEVKILEVLAQARSVTERIKNEQVVLNEIKSDFEVSSDDITEELNNTLEQLFDERNENINKTGQHIFNLIDNDYKNNVALIKYAQEETNQERPSIDHFSYENKKDSIEFIKKKFHNLLSKYEKESNQWQETLSDYKIDKKIESSELYLIPIYTIDEKHEFSIIKQDNKTTKIKTKSDDNIKITSGADTEERLPVEEIIRSLSYLNLNDKELLQFKEEYDNNPLRSNFLDV